MLLWSKDLLVIRPSSKDRFVIWLLNNIYKVLFVKKKLTPHIKSYEKYYEKYNKNMNGRMIQ
jgi:hypothetical protein